VISTPVSIISAISNAARHGILVKGGVFLEEMSRIKVIAMDKTGTLTRGKPSVKDVRAVNCSLMTGDRSSLQENAKGVDQAHLSDCHACRDLIAIACAVEKRSEHPLASAILMSAEALGLLERYRAEQVTALSGRGIKGKINGFEVVIGSHQYFDEHFPHMNKYCDEAKNDTLNGLTPLMIGRDDIYLGTISVSDQVRPSSKQAITALHAARIEPIVMLTGDEENVAKGIAEEVGVDHYFPNLFPEDKRNLLQELGNQFGKIAMIGDGINDAPALAAADVGIAMGGSNGGTAQAMETADITLMSDNLRRLPFLIQLSKSTMRRVYFNVTLSILVKVVFFILVLLGYGTMWMAVFADMGTSLLVTVNGLRLLRNPIPES
jgi:Cd2+/Zn2+-exporting ATPase